MERISGKPGPKPKSELYKAVVPTPFRAGNDPMGKVAEKQVKQTKDWMKTHRA